MGANHMVVLDAKGDVYVGGDNASGQLGLGEGQRRRWRSNSQRG